MLNSNYFSPSLSTHNSLHRKRQHGGKCRPSNNQLITNPPVSGRSFKGLCRVKIHTQKQKCCSNFFFHHGCLYIWFSYVARSKYPIVTISRVVKFTLSDVYSRRNTLSQFDHCRYQLYELYYLLVE